MKVLWFANTPCSAAERLGLNIASGGWLSSLEQELKNIPDIQLAICFYHHKPEKSFVINNVHFFPVYRKSQKNKIRRIIDKMLYFKTICHNDKKEINELLNIINLYNPDIIHVHGTEDNFGLIQFYTKKPVVISIQGLLNPIKEKYFSGIPKNIAVKYETFVRKLVFLSIKRKFKIFNKIAEREKIILKNSKNIIGRTDWDRRITRVLVPESMYFVGNEILRNSFYNSMWDKKQVGNIIKITTITRDSLYKGFENIIKTAQILCENTNIAYIWKVIGVNTHSEIVNIVRKWENIDIKNLHIEVLGTKNEQDVANILLDTDIFCQTSHIENSPNSLCEAMILGMPIVATNAGGSSSILKDKEEGIIVQDGDPYAMAGAIYELINDFDKAIFYGKNARITALKRHDKKEIANTIYTIYKTISIN